MNQSEFNERCVYLPIDEHGEFVCMVVPEHEKEVYLDNGWYLTPADFKRSRDGLVIVQEPGEDRPRQVRKRRKTQPVEVMEFVLHETLPEGELSHGNNSGPADIESSESSPNSGD